MNDLVAVLSFGVFLSGLASAQAPLSDTIIEGDLSVETDSSGGEGALSVDGVTSLSEKHVDMPGVRSDLSLTKASYYGPVKSGPRTHRFDFVFRKDVSVEGDLYLDLPLGKYTDSSRAKVVAMVSDGSSKECAEWILSGSRQQNIKCLRHEAYGVARHFEIKGAMRHGVMWIYLDFDESLAAKYVPA